MSIYRLLQTNILAAYRPTKIVFRGKLRVILEIDLCFSENSASLSSSVVAAKIRKTLAQVDGAFVSRQGRHHGDGGAHMGQPGDKGRARHGQSS